MSLFSKFVKDTTGIKLPDLRKSNPIIHPTVYYFDQTKSDFYKKLQNKIKTGVEKINPNLEQLTNINVPEINMPTLSDNTPNFEQLQPNLDQDLSKISLTGLAESAQKQGGELQKELVNIGSAGQTALTAAGAAGQQALIDAGRAGQQNLIEIGGMVQQGAIDWDQERSSRKRDC